ncbi:PQQ-binding-like beta-propeller repeat protein [Streptomyces sp. PsTaAH-124]|uniref:outer membrane protein assembly factor BamB family protein n=1 Tax=Streptomyces sp. PsTaAH-124 TaxID=1157638 RepID=UPI0003652B43|nr:PQQ-binding-like beta-propeller repeat protein [Streptomyces sp. PsTaAH-124]
MSFGPPPSPYTQSALAADRTRRRRRIRVLGAVAVVVAAAVGVGGWILSSAGDDRPAAAPRPSAAPQSPDDIRELTEKTPVTPEGKLLVEYREGDLAKTVKGDPRYAPGTWATEKVLAKGVGNRIEGLTTAATGDEKAWTLKLDGPLCATSKHLTADGRTAVVVQPVRSGSSEKSGVCDQVVFFDVNTGKKLWQATMPSADRAFVTNTNLTMTKGVVAVAWGQGSVAYDMKSGKQLWNSTTVSACEDSGFAGGRALLVLEKCGGESSEPTYRVEKLEPRTGKPLWTYKVAGGVEDVFLPSSDPAVLAVAAGDTSVTDLITLDGTGKRLATLSMTGYDPKCGERDFGAGYFGKVEYCDGVVVGRDHLYVVSKETTELRQAANWIVAFDVRTGKAGRKLDARPSQPMAPLQMSGDDLLVFRRSYSTIEPSSVIRWNPATGKETPFLYFGLPDEDGGLADIERSDILVGQGRVYFAQRELTADEKHPTYPVTAVVGIGSAGARD